MADSVANLWDLLPLWDQLHAPVAGLTSFEPDLAVRYVETTKTPLLLYVELWLQ